MNSRQRVKCALAFHNPDRVPISHAVLPAAQLKYGQALDDILTMFREDFGWDYMQNMALEDFPAVYKKGRNTDDFGTVWFSEWLGVCGIPVEWPLAELSRYEEFKWPEDFTAGPPRGRLYSGHMAGYDDRWYARGAWITYFEQLQQLRGMEKILMDIAGESKEFYRLLDDLLDFNLRWIDAWTKLEYDGLHFADDWGGQSSLLIKPETWRRIFKPRYAQMFRRVGERGMDVWYHTDGQIRDIFGDLIEIGVQAINCQVPVVGHDWIASNVRGRVAIRTDIDRQRVMPLGSTTEVGEEVHRTFEACGSSQGGIIACGEVGPDVPLENIRAMYEAFLEYGTYPSERIVVVEGDITKQQVDAIVNAANTTLLGGGGVDGAIHRAAGPQLVEECSSLGGCPTGQARITKGYNLPAKWVIHTVGPVWHGFGRREDELLASCYRTALELAVEKGVRTIAFPAISTGVYGFPLERATAIAVKEVKGFLEENPSLEKVVFVCFGKHAYECYLNAARHR